MSKLTALLKKRRALIATGIKAFAEADKVDEEIIELIDRASEILGGGDEAPRAKLTAHQRKIERKVEQLFQNNFQSKVSLPPRGRTPSLLAPIREVLEHGNNQPITQEKLLLSLQTKGVTVKGKKPKSTLSAHVSYLIKKNVLVRVGDKIALKQPPLMPAAEATRTH
jgi:hypothetical protein